MKYPAYRGYTSSNRPELGNIPPGWETRRLKFVATCNDEALPETTDPDVEIVYVDISSVDLINGITAVEAYTFEDAPSRARRIVRDGDTIVSTVRTYLKAIAPIEAPPENMIVSTGFAVIRPLGGIDSRFLGYALQNSIFIDSVVVHSSGVSYPAINPTTLVCLPVSYPKDQKEQQKIAAFLGLKTSQIDALIAKKKELVEKLKEKHLAVITQAVTKGLNPGVPLDDSGIPWLGEIPKHWAAPALKMRYAVELGKMLDEKRIRGDRLVPYLRNVDVQWNEINFDELPEMDIAEDEYSRYTIRESDVLVCEGGEVGRAAVVGARASVVGFQKALHRLRAETDVEMPKFIFYTLLWAVHTGIFAVEGSSTIAHLTADQLRRYRFPQPPLSEQKTIVTYLDEEVGRILHLVERVNVAIARLTEYRMALITAATTGKIDVRHVPVPANANQCANSANFTSLMEP